MVRTFLTKPGTRDFTERPRVDLGGVRFGGWQIHQVPSSADAYLIRISLDILLDPGTARPEWADASLDFDTCGVAVLDAVPKSVRTPEPARIYRLSSILNFIPAAPGEPVNWPVPVGSQDPVLHAFGTGGPDFRWRWSTEGGVAPGHRSGWLVLLVPVGVRELRVRPSAAFAPPPGDGWLPACDPVDRVVPLPRPEEKRAPASFDGSAALKFTRRLGDSWPDLATLLAVPTHDQAGFERGREAGHLWRWLEARNELGDLPDALEEIDRPDLAKQLRDLI
jgi:hypothetical protein